VCSAFWFLVLAFPTFANNLKLSINLFWSSTTVQQISADIFEENTAKGKEYYYQVLVHTDKNYLERNSKICPIRPGMVAQVDVLGGKRTVLSYLLKPLIKAKLH